MEPLTNVSLAGKRALTSPSASGNLEHISIMPKYVLEGEKSEWSYRPGEEVR